jgi:hypothetical protein
MPVRTTHWELQPHTKAKHEILERYLEAWLPILSSCGVDPVSWTPHH